MWEIMNNQHGEIETLAQNLLNSSHVPELFKLLFMFLIQPSPPHKVDVNSIPIP